MLYKTDPRSLGLLAALMKAGFIIHMWRDEEEYVQMFGESITILWLSDRKNFYVKRNLKLEKNEIFILTILKAQVISHMSMNKLLLRIYI